MPAMPKKHRGMGVNTTIDMSIKDLDSAMQDPPKACMKVGQKRSLTANLMHDMQSLQVD